MDLQGLSKCLDFAKKRKKWVLLLVLFGVSSYGAYKVYNFPSLARKRRRLSRFLKVLFSVLEVVSDSAETIGVVSKDLKEFLNSSSDEIPNSIRQLSKFARSNEFSNSLTRVSEALTVGILRGYNTDNSRNQGRFGGEVSLVERVMDRVLSKPGIGFVSAVVGSFARNLVLGFHSSIELNDCSTNGNRMMENRNALIDGGESTSISKFLNVICSSKSKELIADCIQVFVSTAIEVYLDKTLDINFYDEIFVGLTNPNHETKMRDILVSICNGAVETLVKTSHQVLTSNNNIDPNPSSNGESSNMNGCEYNDGDKAMNGEQMFEKGESGGWGSMVVSTLSIPRNRRFVLDVTGRVTFETVRSLVEFSLWKVLDGLRSSGKAINDHVKYKGRQVVTFFGLKSYVVITIFFALYLHIICGTRVLLPA